MKRDAVLCTAICVALLYVSAALRVKTHNKVYCEISIRNVDRDVYLAHANDVRTDLASRAAAAFRVNASTVRVEPDAYFDTASSLVLRAWIYMLSYTRAESILETYETALCAPLLGNAVSVRFYAYTIY